MARESIMELAADKLKLPAEVVAGVPRIEITGGRQVLIDNHKGMLEYESERIVVNGGRMRVVIVGKNLCLKAMNSKEMLIGGSVSAVELEYKE